MALSVGSLFSGIGGIDLGLERAGMVTRWFCEIDPHCRNVLARHWPGLPIYGDIAAVDWSGVEPVDVVAGGFPCQPVSAAGLRHAQNDERWLWPEFARAICELRPRYVFVENVPGLLWPWLDKDGCGLWHPAPIEEVVGDLVSLGYESEWDCIPAHTVGSPQGRDRLWLVAHPSGGELQRGREPDRLDAAPRTAEEEAGQRQRFRGASGNRRSPMANAASVSQREWPQIEPALVRAPDGLSVGLDGHRWPAPPGPQYEWEPPRIVSDGGGIRRRQVSQLGNAVVPQVVEWIGRRIVASDEGRVNAV